jgi:DNA-binding transcriptional MocR family regulator
VNAIAQYQIDGSSSREIAAGLERAIHEGGLEPGAPLPTIRGLADDLTVSPATVAAAYRLLQARGLVTGQGRRGTRVAPRPAIPSRALADVPAGARDLTIGYPDVELLPPLAPALRRVAADPPSFAGKEGNDPELVALATAAFRADGIPTEAVAVVGGALDGIERALRAHLRPGDRVAIEDPAYPPCRDQLLGLGLVAVPVRVDDAGMVPEALARALARGIQAAIVVPRAQNPVGAALDPERAADLRALLDEHPDVLVIEDDHAGRVAGAPSVSVAGGERWAVIRSTSKLLHPDLRVALMTGDPTTIARVEGHQILGPGWVSHLLQRLVCELLGDPATARRIERAAEAYARRREALIDALARRGVAAHGRSGLNVWVPLREELPVVQALRDAGWAVASGERFRIESPPGIRVTTAGLREDEAEQVAEVIARVERPARPRHGY